MRVRIDLGYDGTRFSGWAVQPGLRTVAGVVGECLATILRAPHPVLLTVAGRTDAGVHARGQVCHADLPVQLWGPFAAGAGDDRPPASALESRLRRLVPEDVAVRRVALAPPGFDARFSALWRRYRYRIADRPADQDPLRRHDTAWHGRELDERLMARAAESLLGLHDFAAFCRRREGGSTIRDLQLVRPARAADGVLEIEVQADAFCHSMVRSIVGALVAVGSGRREADWVTNVLHARLRDSAVRVMPARGLTLEQVGYPPDERLAERADEARRRRDTEPSGEVSSGGP